MFCFKIDLNDNSKGHLNVDCCQGVIVSCKRPCFDQLHTHILERLQNSKRSKMCAFSWSNMAAHRSIRSLLGKWFGFFIYRETKVLQSFEDTFWRPKRPLLFNGQDLLRLCIELAGLSLQSFLFQGDDFPWKEIILGRVGWTQVIFLYVF